MGRAVGRINAGGAYHFYMETQVAVASVLDGEYVEVVCGSQDLTACQSRVASLVGVPQNKVIVSCPRTGGGFGGKLSGNMTVAGAAALCALKLKKPVRIFNSRIADMTMQGGREAWQFQYEVGYNDDGLITALKYDIHVDGGSASGDTLASLAMGKYFFV